MRPVKELEVSMNEDLKNVRVIVFDTFGTVVDWRGSIASDLSVWGAARGIALDWERMADLWRGQYYPQLARVRSGEVP